MTTQQQSYLTPEVKAMVGVQGEKVEVTIWGIEKEHLRRFVHAIMDPDPRYWDEEFARTTKFGEVIMPPIYCTYMNKTAPGAEDPISRAFRNNPVSDGIGGLDRGRPGALPPLPLPQMRVLNAGNDIEVFKYPSLGDRIFSQQKYGSIIERVGRDGSHMLIVTNETIFTNQKDEVLCITRSSGIRR
ncbi:MAG: MaoC family dehydratase N-terminal domain-containing protein [Chloroflexi bacterium]|nr:MaoC family dehydratase N-terminal domain-containing protein [Chloroflexota bacterium]